MKKETEMKEFIKYFSLWITEIRLSNDIGFYDVNRISEGFVCKFLNLLYDYSLVNLNDEVKNMCAADLGDEQNGIAFQITSRTDGNKIKDTLEKFKKYQLDEKYSNGIKFFILSNEPVKLGRRDYCKIYEKFNREDIITQDKILKEIGKIYDTKYSVFQDILTLFKENLSSTNIEKNITDEEVLEKMARCLDRPAFVTPFYLENNFGDFRKAIDDTIEAFNTGVYRLRDGTLIEKIYPKSMITNTEIRYKIDDIVCALIELRVTYNRLERDGDIELCRDRDNECTVSLWSIEARDKMDDIRRNILKSFKEIYPKFNAKFIEM